MKGPESSPPPSWTQLSCYEKCLTEVAGTWPSLWLFLFFSFSFSFTHLLSVSVSQQADHSQAPSLPGVVGELTIPGHMPTFLAYLFPLFSINTFLLHARESLMVMLIFSLLCCINAEVKVPMFVGKLLSKVRVARRSGKMDCCSVVK